MQRNLIVIYAIAAFGISLLSQPILAGAVAQMNASAVQSQATVDGDSTFTLIRGRGVHGMRGGHVAYRGGHAIGRGHGVRTERRFTDLASFVERTCTETICAADTSRTEGVMSSDAGTVSEPEPPSTDLASFVERTCTEAMRAAGAIGAADRVVRCPGRWDRRLLVVIGTTEMPATVRAIAAPTLITLQLLRK